MMDALIAVIVKAIVKTIGKAILKSFPEIIEEIRPQEDEKQGLIEPTLATEKEVLLSNNQRDTILTASAAAVESTMIRTKPQNTLSTVENQSPWQGQIDQNMLINGLIFTEILQPPRAKRPFGKM